MNILEATIRIHRRQKTVNYFILISEASIKHENNSLHYVLNIVFEIQKKEDQSSNKCMCSNNKCKTFEKIKFFLENIKFFIIVRNSNEKLITKFKKCINLKL